LKVVHSMRFFMHKLAILAHYLYSAIILSR